MAQNHIWQSYSTLMKNSIGKYFLHISINAGHSVSQTENKWSNGRNYLGNIQSEQNSLHINRCFSLSTKLLQNGCRVKKAIEEFTKAKETASACSLLQFLYLSSVVLWINCSLNMLILIALQFQDCMQQLLQNSILDVVTHLV